MPRTMPRTMAASPAPPRSEPSVALGYASAMFMEWETSYPKGRGLATAMKAICGTGHGSNCCKGNAVLQQTKGASVALVLKAIRQAPIAILILLLLLLLVFLALFGLPLALP